MSVEKSATVEVCTVRTMYASRSTSSTGPGGGIYQAPLRAGAAGVLADPATAAVGVYSSAAAYAAAAAAAHGYVPFAVDSVAFYPSLQVTVH